MAIVWHGKPVKLCIWALMTMQVRDYIATWSSHPSGTQAPVKGKGVDARPLPSESHLDNGSQRELTKDLCDLDDDQLWEALEAAQLKPDREGTAPHMGLPQAVSWSLDVAGWPKWMMGK